MNEEKIIKSLMVLKDLRQEDVSRKMNLSIATFNKKLTRKGTSKFNIDEAIKLVEILDCTLDDIFLKGKKKEKKIA